MKNNAVRGGLDEPFIRALSEHKKEPSWMTDFRCNAYAHFMRMKVPKWGANLSALDFDDLCYYVASPVDVQNRWEDIPENIKKTFDGLGIVKAEQLFLAGVGAQYESEVIYKNLKKEWSAQGVIFCDTNTGLREHEALFRKHFATVVPPGDNKFAALNSAVWSGGSFIYVPPGVQVKMPLQAYFLIQSARMGQFERTLIIADEGSFVHYVEGCSAPAYQKNSLHSAVVELIALPGAHIRYTTIQNWSKNVYNLVTKRAVAYRHAKVEWVDGNFGSKVTMKYPCVVLKEPGAKGHVISVAVAHEGQHQDTGAKMIHLAPNTTSHVVAKSISMPGARTSYRGLLKIVKGAKKVKAYVQCEALLLGKKAYSDTYPTMLVKEHDVSVGHEASVTKISQEQLWYLQARGLRADTARALVVNGFIDAFVQELPMEYAVEINRLIALEMEGSIG
ncbi:MAG TPA: Fe-S cluster assembly protein SufB [Candidatus Bathyarchaeia archaeon]|nr:Fe-S cluster assembly protein SufB [Candidatus Bathyarchaeia archaeon]